MRRFIGVILVMTLVLLCASCNSARKKEVNDITLFDTVCTADEADMGRHREEHDKFRIS